MNALLLCAGRGERLRPLTDTLPKPLVPVAGHPMLDYHLRALAAAAVQRVVINLSWLGEQIRAAVGDGRRYGLEVHFSEEGPEPLETGGAAVRARELLGEAPFLVINADVWCDVSLDALVDASLPGEDLARVVLVDNPPHHPDGDFSIDADRLVLRADRAFTFSGIGLYRHAFFDGYPERFSLADPLRRYAADGRVGAVYHPGAWFDMGSPERLDALRAFLEGPNAQS